MVVSVQGVHAVVCAPPEHGVAWTVVVAMSLLPTDTYSIFLASW